MVRRAVTNGTGNWICTTDGIDLMSRACHANRHFPDTHKDFAIVRVMSSTEHLSSCRDMAEGELEVPQMTPSTIPEVDESFHLEATDEVGGRDADQRFGGLWDDSAPALRRGAALQAVEALATTGMTSSGTRLLQVQLSSQRDITLFKWELVDAVPTPTVVVPDIGSFDRYMVEVCSRGKATANTSVSIRGSFDEAMAVLDNISDGAVPSRGEDVVFEARIFASEARWERLYWGGPTGPLVAIDKPLSSREQMDAVLRTTTYCLEKSLEMLQAGPPDATAIDGLAFTGLKGIGELSRSSMPNAFASVVPLVSAAWNVVRGWVADPTETNRMAVLREIRTVVRELAAASPAPPDGGGIQL